MSETVLVIGGTGMLGEPVARRLLEDGHTVRVLTRNPERAAGKLGKDFEVVRGDVEDLASLEQALEGCTGVHVSLDGGGDWDLERRGGVNVAEVGARLGLERITMITGASTCEANTWFPMVRAKLAAENAIRESGVGYTIFRCTMFMEMLSNLVKGDKALVIGHQPFAWHFLAASDYARMVSKAYVTPEAAGKILYIYGPEAITMEQAMEQYRAACAPEAKLTKLPFWLVWLVSRLPSRRELREVGYPIMRYFAKVQETESPDEANELLGAPTTTLAEWCERWKGWNLSGWLTAVCHVAPVVAWE